jgi:hypothetical protein
MERIAAALGVSQATITADLADRETLLATNNVEPRTDSLGRRRNQGRRRGSGSRASLIW